MYIIYCFSVDNPDGKSPWTKQNVLYIIQFFALDQIPKIKMPYGHKLTS